MTDSLRDRSVVATAIGRTVRRLRTATATARVGRLLPRSIGSRLETTESTADTGPQRESRVATIARRSTVASALERTRDRTGATTRAAMRNARLTGAGETGRRFVRGSFCYRWLTAEPDPDVIVIDLRETLTVGPPLRAIQRSLEALAPSVATARLATAGRAVASTLRARPIRVASLVLLGTVVTGVVALVASGNPSPIPVATLVALGLLAAVGVRSRATWDGVRESRIVGLLVAAFEPPEPPEPATERTDTDDSEQRPGSRSIDGRGDGSSD